MTALANGIHQLTREQYDAITTRAHWSKLKVMGKSPAHYRHLIENPPGPDKDAWAKGRVTHLAAYEPELLGSVAIWTGKTRNGKKWDEFKAAAKKEGRELVTAAAYKSAVAIGKAARECPQAARYMNGGRGEVTVLWTFKVPPVGALGGWEVDCKARLDFIAKIGALVDLKTTKDASPEAFGRQAFNLGYHGQAALYDDGYFEATGERLPYYIVAVETAPPHVTQVYDVTPLLDLGRELYQTQLARLNHCRKHSEWPGYATTPMELTFPRWAVPSDEDASAADLDLGFSDNAA